MPATMHDCSTDNRDSHGRCLGYCRECGEHLESTGRYNVFCRACDCCPECGCPDADGFTHYMGCKETAESEEELDPWDDPEDSEEEDFEEGGEA